VIFNTISVRRKLVPALCLLALAVSTGWTQKSELASPAVTVTGGKVLGKFWEDGRGATFRGIPYAQPPVGELRWHEPMPVRPWSGVRQAFEFAPACAQMNAGWNADAAQNGKEDCLYLNVDTPDLTTKQLKPVMMWIHGGANTGGNADELSSGRSLCKRGVVVVSIQYRLGLLGFMAHPELTKESPHHSSGNYALLDQLAALRWVSENIAVFGGDPKKVTIFGQSAGAFDIALLMASPLSKGLFVGVIEQSGPALSFRPTLTLAEAEREGGQVAEKLGAPRNGSLPPRHSG
jgi:para-nitrobenzyl esterase